MNRFQPIQYIKRYAIIVFVLFMVPTMALYVFLKKRQTYTAAVVIEYAYDGAQNGQLPDGSRLDVTEIYSSSVINQVLDNLGLDAGLYPIDSIRSAISITQLADQEVLAVNTARNEEGLSSDLQSTRYEISYKAEAGQGEELTGAILDEIVDVYFTQFSSLYVNNDAIVNSVSDISREKYDYLEQIELINEALEKTIGGLEGRAEASPAFYSAGSGYSFQGLADDFRLLQNTQISALASYILNHQVTRDKDVLLAKYGQRIRNYELDKIENQMRVEDVEGILETYVGKLRESDNTAQPELVDGSQIVGNRNVLGNVESPIYSDTESGAVAYDQTTEYEKLLKNWVEGSDRYNQSVIDAAYCQYVIDCFSGRDAQVTAYQTEMARIGENSQAQESEGGESMPLESDSVEEIGREEQPENLVPAFYTQTTAVCTPEDVTYVERRLDRILHHMNRLYEIVRAADAEYNEYLGAQYIQMLSSNHVYPGLNVMRYTVVGAVLFLLASCIGIVLLGRLGDIWQYMIYTDHRYQLPNRIAGDLYINKYREKVLSAGFGCLFFQVSNQEEINRRFGRESGNEAVAYFASALDSLFQGAKNFVGYNGNNQFIVFTQGTDGIGLRRAMEDFQIFLHEHFRDRGIVLKYVAGMAESSEEKLFQIQSLIGAAAGHKQAFEAGEDRKDTHGREKT